jgi:1-deoxy-D-xylulose-5-phosphate reductoisomerase
MTGQRTISVLGATGSIGASTLDLVRRNPDAFRVVALTANAQAAELAALAREFRAEVAVVADEARLPELREHLAGSGVEAAGGPTALVEAAARGADITVAAIVGARVLPPPWRRSNRAR